MRTRDGRAVRYLFGEFVLSPSEQRLLRDGKAVRLGGRPLEILTALVERAGDVVSKEELTRRAWPQTNVDDSNLKVNVAAIRRALGGSQPETRFIAAVSGRGYRFVAPVDVVPLPRATTARRHNLPPVQHLFGRLSDVTQIAAALLRSPLVTITGPGGVGKTSLAVAVGHESVEHFQDGVWLVDVCVVDSDRYLASAFAQEMGIAVLGDDPQAGLTTALADRQCLLIVDCCENSLDQVARLTTMLAATAPRTRVLATSREPLRTAGEFVRHLEPLPVPPVGTARSATETRVFPAVELFIERASAAAPNLVVHDDDVLTVAEICRRLDGLPLALELAATRLAAFGLRGLSRLLNERLDVLDVGRREGHARHGGLTATLDWSYGLLSEDERALYRSLSVFHGAFSLDAAIAVGALAGTVEASGIGRLADLVAKSLVVAVPGRAPRYRLLDTTREYGLRRLAESGELDAVRRRHAEYCLSQCLEVAKGRDARPVSHPHEALTGLVHNVRVALEWCFSGRGDAALGRSLASAALTLWERLSLLQELIETSARSLATAGPGDNREGVDEIRLRSSLATALLQVEGPTERIVHLWTGALARAERTADPDGELRALWGLCDYKTWVGDHRASLVLAERIRALAAANRDRAASVAVDRPAATSLRYLGRLDEARDAAERLLARARRSDGQGRAPEVHGLVAARGTLANVLWLQGLPDQAVEASRRALADAEESGQAFALTNALAHTVVPIALHVENLDEAERGLDRLRDHVAHHSMRIWRVITDCLAAIVGLRHGDAGALHHLRDALAEMGETGFRMRRPAYLGSLASGLARHGRHSDALAEIDMALVASDYSGELWCRPELLRIKGEILLASAGSSGETEAAQHMLEALAMAGGQGAKIWQLRAATSLASLDERYGGRAALLPILTSFDQGADTRDVRAARARLAGGTGHDAAASGPVSLA
jgi:predicted ATPase/DNA-binding winged helix-turn-helix (wHTH) protein